MRLSQEFVWIKKEFDNIRAFVEIAATTSEKIKLAMLYLWFSVVLVVAKLNLKLLSTVDKFRIDGAICVSLLRLYRLLCKLLRRARVMVFRFGVDEDEECEEEEEEE